MAGTAGNEQQQHQLAPSEGPLVSVIVTTRNSSATLKACLESLKTQTYCPLELIVVDNASTDATPAIARRLADHTLERGPERSAQRNFGVGWASGEFVLVVDADMVLTETIIEECVSVARATNAAAVVVPERSEGEGLWARAKALERSCYIGDPTIEAARFFERKAFLRYGGYDEELTGPEDWDLPARMEGERFARVESVIVHLEGQPTLIGLARKKYYYGKGFARYIRRHRSLAREQVRFVRPAFVRHRDRLAHQPLLSAAMMLMKAVEYGAGGAGLVVGLTSSAVCTRGRR